MKGHRAFEQGLASQVSDAVGVGGLAAGDGARQPDDVGQVSAGLGALVRQMMAGDGFHHGKGQPPQAEQAGAEAIGQLAAGIAHEINTPIQYVSDNASFLETAFEKVGLLLDETLGFADALEAEGVAPTRVADLRKKFEVLKMSYLRAEIPRALAETAEGLGRVSAIVGAMKEFSHPSSGEKETVDLHETINTTITVARHEWKYVADVETEFDHALPAVPCHRNELSQALLNLIVNAAHAIGERGEREGKGKILLATQQVGQEVEIRVKDDGVGIPTAVAKRVYEPFFTTKEVGKGTGQGLAMARSAIVDKHGGSIRFETVPGVGTCFFIRLPLTTVPVTFLAARDTDSKGMNDDHRKSARPARG